MYAKCVAENPNCEGCELSFWDNRKNNDRITVAYNGMLAGRPADEEAWYVFCHEDFQMLEPLLPRLAELDKDSLWGPIGATTVTRFGVYHQWRLLGSVEECKKDGSDSRRIGEKTFCGDIVDTFDCQCLVVHSSLVRRLRLRFDENLSFDLYVEDFCIAADVRGGIVSRILPLEARHWSGGNVQPRYRVQEAYLDGKYPDSCHTGTSSWTIGKKIPFFRRVTVALKKIFRWFADGGSAK
jgi:hypothetical protein